MANGTGGSKKIRTRSSTEEQWYRGHPGVVKAAETTMQTAIEKYIDDREKSRKGKTPIQGIKGVMTMYAHRKLFHQSALKVVPRTRMSPRPSRTTCRRASLTRSDRRKLMFRRSLPFYWTEGQSVKLLRSLRGAVVTRTVAWRLADEVPGSQGREYDAESSAGKGPR